MLQILGLLCKSHSGFFDQPGTDFEGILGLVRHSLGRGWLAAKRKCIQ